MQPFFRLAQEQPSGGGGGGGGAGGDICPRAQG